MTSKSGLIRKVYDLSDSFKHASAAILFGSVARGEYDRRSDIDILLIYSDEEMLSEDKEAFDEVSSIDGMEVQIVARTLEELKKSDKIFLREVFKDGIVLFVREPLLFKASELLGIKPYRLYTYTMKNLRAGEKKRLISALYGYSTRKIVGEKEYVYEYKGIADAKFGRNCFFVEESKSKQVEELFESYDVHYGSIRVWLEAQSIEIIAKTLQSRIYEVI